MDLKALIEKQRLALEQPKTASAPIVAGGEMLTVSITKIDPNDWQTLVGEHYPRKGVDSDLNVGYDQHSLPRDYPVSRIRVEDEEVDVETWQSLYDVIDSTHKNTIGSTMYGLNVLDAIRELGALGKAKARSGSPANRESRRAASKAGNPQK